ncbi:hypothetical protein CMEL01_16288 [Colletotrichum melonis]|uniref:Uncharacterized protein n=1 Tax=Colletotrichum melonis TaxID=1209925 RepID=A0AAI9UE09_9PEZI|nr:hypothetical protein CMEL01_16288 [Colletotrichum melonis]
MFKQSESVKRIIRDVQKDGSRKMTPDQVVHAWNVPMTSEIPAPKGADKPLPNLWIEEGTPKSGLRHMVGSDEEIDSWEGKGIPRELQREKIPMFVEAATTAGRRITTQGSRDDRHIMSTYIEGRVLKTAVTVGSNGYIVGANPAKKFKVKPRDPGEVSDRTVENLYRYPLNCPDIRRTDEAKKGEEMERKEPAMPKAKTSHLGRFFNRDK